MLVMGQHKHKKQLLVYLKPELHQHLKLQSARTGTSMSKLVEQAVRVSLGAEQVPVADQEVERPEVVEALAKYGAPLWSSGRPTQLSLEETVATALTLARRHPSLLRVLPVVLYKNRSRLSWSSLRERTTDLPALGMLLDLTAELTGVEMFSTWARELDDTVRPGPGVPFFERGGSRRYRELARQHTPELVRRWGYQMATPMDDFHAAMRRFCPDLTYSTART